MLGRQVGELSGHLGSSGNYCPEDHVKKPGLVLSAHMNLFDPHQSAIADFQNQAFWCPDAFTLAYYEVFCLPSRSLADI